MVSLRVHPTPTTFVLPYSTGVLRRPTVRSDGESGLRYARVIVPRTRIEDLALEPTFASTLLWLRGSALEFVHERLAVRIPVTRSPDDTDGPVPTLALRLGREIDEEVVLQVDEARIQRVARFARIGIDVDPPYDELRELVTRRPVRARVAFDVTLLTLIASAFQERTILLEVRGTEDPLVIRPNAPGAREEALVAPTLIER